MTQTIALFVDAYRELNARKLFWFVLGLTLLFVGAVACVGINDKGITLFIWTFPVDILNTRTISPSLFYRFTFFALGFQLWLTWAATILALVSTAPLIPEFVGSGAIELTLSKPIGRLRLFLTKYATGLLFAALQVTVFTVAAFLVVGLRGGAWDLRLFWGIPFVVLFFSFLYCVCALIGLWTRSTVAALLVTLLLWLTNFLIHGAETGVVLTLRVQHEQAVAILEDEIAKLDRQIAESRAPAGDEGPASPPAGPGVPPSGDEATGPAPSALEARRETRLVQLEGARKDLRKLTNVHAIMFAVKTLLPKTSETMNLLQRELLEDTELDRFREQAEERRARGGFSTTVAGVRVSQRSIEREMKRVLDARGVPWILGTSLLFEAVLLAAASWMFVRRDF